MGAIHQEALERALAAKPAPVDAAQLARRASEFFLESLSAFEMSDLAFRDMNARLQTLTGELQAANIQLLRENEERTRVEAAVRKLNAELEQQSAQLEAANTVLEAFSYSVSHDLRAPLRHIGGYVALLNKDAASSLDEKNRRYLGVIAESAARMGKLIDDLLAFSHIGRSDLNKVRFAMLPVVQEIIRELEPDTQGREIAWQIEPLPDVRADRSMLCQVWANLISNALKYTRAQAHVVIEIGSRAHEQESVFFIRDNGAGFDMKYVDKLFGVFQRLHSAREFEGTGIGLANVQRIVSRHGGRAWAEGVVNGGATFYFSLPGPEVG
jgi:light-regulated signal transduction histidine kinase (bacteriophytochrome)